MSRLDDLQAAADYFKYGIALGHAADQIAKLKAENGKLRAAGREWAGECRKAQDYAMRLRAALEQILAWGHDETGRISEIARRALEGK